MAASSSTTTTASMSGPTSGGSIFPSPPPPTPSNHHPRPAAGCGGADAALSAFLHRLLLSSPATPLHSPPAARSCSPVAPPLVSLQCPDSRPVLAAAAADVAYFHLVGHGVPSYLPSSALAELSVLDAPARGASNLCTLGFSEEEQEAEGADDPVKVFDVDEGAIDVIPAAAEFARRMKEVGMEVVALLSGCPDVGFGEEPFGDGRRKARCLMWVSKVAGGGEASSPPAAGKAKAYPYVVGLHCQWETTGRETLPASWVMGDDGDWTTVGARDGALLVTMGDVAQVWSNGKFKKVRGMPRPFRHGESDRLSVTVLITLPLDSVISPLVPFLDAEDDDCDGTSSAVVDGDGWKFHSFLLEEYAWRVYHERFQFKDPLARYRI